MKNSTTKAHKPSTTTTNITGNIPPVIGTSKPEIRSSHDLPKSTREINKSEFIAKFEHEFKTWVSSKENHVDLQLFIYAFENDIADKNLLVVLKKITDLDDISPQEKAFCNTLFQLYNSKDKDKGMNAVIKFIEKNPQENFEPSLATFIQNVHINALLHTQEYEAAITLIQQNKKNLPLHPDNESFLRLAQAKLIKHKISRLTKKEYETLLHTPKIHRISVDAQGNFHQQDLQTPPPQQPLPKEITSEEAFDKWIASSENFKVMKKANERLFYDWKSPQGKKRLTLFQGDGKFFDDFIRAWGSQDMQAVLKVTETCPTEPVDDPPATVRIIGIKMMRVHALIATKNYREAVEFGAALHHQNPENQGIFSYYRLAEYYYYRISSDTLSEKKKTSLAIHKKAFDSWISSPKNLGFMDQVHDSFTHESGISKNEVGIRRLFKGQGKFFDNLADAFFREKNMQKVLQLTEKLPPHLHIDLLINKIKFLRLYALIQTKKYEEAVVSGHDLYRLDQAESTLTYSRLAQYYLSKQPSVSLDKNQELKSITQSGIRRLSDQANDIDAFLYKHAQHLSSDTKDLMRLIYNYCNHGEFEKIVELSHRILIPLLRKDTTYYTNKNLSEEEKHAFESFLPQWETIAIISYETLSEKNKFSPESGLAEHYGIAGDLLKLRQRRATGDRTPTLFRWVNASSFSGEDKDKILERYEQNMVTKPLEKRVTGSIEQKKEDMKNKLAKIDIKEFLAAADRMDSDKSYHTEISQKYIDLYIKKEYKTLIAEINKQYTDSAGKIHAENFSRTALMLYSLSLYHDGEIYRAKQIAGLLSDNLQQTHSLAISHRPLFFALAEMYYSLGEEKAGDLVMKMLERCAKMNKLAIRGDDPQFSRAKKKAKKVLAQYKKIVATHDAQDKISQDGIKKLNPLLTEFEEQLENNSHHMGFASLYEIFYKNKDYAEVERQILKAYTNEEGMFLEYLCPPESLILLSLSRCRRGNFEKIIELADSLHNSASSLQDTLQPTMSEEKKRVFESFKTFWKEATHISRDVMSKKQRVLDDESNSERKPEGVFFLILSMLSMLAPGGALAKIGFWSLVSYTVYYILNSTGYLPSAFTNKKDEKDKEYKKEEWLEQCEKIDSTFMSKKQLGNLQSLKNTITNLEYSTTSQSTIEEIKKHLSALEEQSKSSFDSTKANALKKLDDIPQNQRPEIDSVQVTKESIDKLTYGQEQTLSRIDNKLSEVENQIKAQKKRQEDALETQKVNFQQAKNSLLEKLSLIQKKIQEYPELQETFKSFNEKTERTAIQLFSFEKQDGFETKRDEINTLQKQLGIEEDKILASKNKSTHDDSRTSTKPKKSDIQRRLDEKHDSNRHGVIHALG